MPRPRQSRATRAAQAAAAPASRPASADSISSDLYGHSDREQERLRSEQGKQQQPKRVTSTRLEGAARRSSPRLSSTTATTSLRSPGAPGSDLDEPFSGDMDASVGLTLSDNDVDDTVSVGRDQAAHGRRLHNSSALDTAQLHRRRPRASSIIGPGDAPIRPSSRGLSTPRVSTAFNIGAFRRRAREPSILGTSRKRRPEEDEDSEDSDELEGAEGSTELGIVRDDGGKEKAWESTPRRRSLRPSRTPRQRASERPLRSSSGSQKTPQTADSGREPRGRGRRSIGSPATNGRPERSSRVSLQSVQGLDEGAGEGMGAQDGEGLPVQEVAEPLASPVAVSGPLLISDDDGDSLSDMSMIGSPLSVAPLPALRGAPVVLTAADLEVVAPPQSSEAEDVQEVVLPDVHVLGKRRRRHSLSSPLQNRGGAESEVSSPPSLTHSPNARPSKKAPAPPHRHHGRPAQEQPSPKPKTAELASLLPKRARQGKADGRRHGENGEKGDYDMDDEAEDGQNGEFDTSTLGPDDDELSHAETRVRKRPKRQATQRSAHSKAKSQPLTLAQKLKRAGQEARANGRSQDARPGSHRTYTLRRASDQENTDDVQDDGGQNGAEGNGDVVTTEAGQGEEIRLAKIKFKEVDKWQLEFEEAAESSSPEDAR